MRICPQCRTAYPASATRCTRDGAALADAREFAEAQSDPLVGTVLADRFEILGRVGVGGMGTVYRAVQRPLGREVALKILKDEVSWDPDTITRFHREAKAMSRLVHANTVRVFDFGQTAEGMLYLAMELLEGELLTNRLDREGPLDPIEAIRIAQQILSSLHEAHSKGIIHRDLKPDNIYLAAVEGHAELVVKVLDFGIAKVVQGENTFDQLETQAGTVFGTPRYMSPEQAQGKSLDPRSDLYSVAVLLYQLLTGKPPFVDEDAVIVMAKHIREKVVPPRRAAPHRPIPASLNRAVLKGMEKEADRRFQAADEMVAKLEDCIADAEAAKVVHTGIFGRIRQGLVSLPAMPVYIAGALLLLSMLGGAWVIARGEDAPAPPAEVAGPAPEPTPVVLDDGTAIAILVSIPAGAEVWHSGERLGVTPLRLGLPSGETRQVELRKDGFEDAAGLLIADERERTVILSERTPEASPNMRRVRRPRPNMRPSMSAMSAMSTTTMAGPDPYERFD